MKTLILGCGNIGTTAAQDLANNMPKTQITLADNDKQRARTTAEKINKSNVTWTQLDVTNTQQLQKTIADTDLIMGFLPGKLGYPLMKECIRAQRNLVDVSFMEENPLTLQKEATKAKITIIPDCGLAPGISNILIGHATRQLTKTKKIHIMVGGLPEKPIPPLEYVVTWSPESLIDEYTRQVTIIRNGKKTCIAPLTGTEQIKFPRLGKLEAFFTDGLRSLIETITNVEEMWEKTLRYPGHAEKIRLLSQLGFFDPNPIHIENTEISPRKITAKLLDQKLARPEIRDIVALSVHVSGLGHGKTKSYTYHLLDRFDNKNHITSMARTTAYPASIIAQLVLEGKIQEKGIVPPEKLGKNDEVFYRFMKEMKKRQIIIKETKT
jgi:lysine 6-dehydrogenase